MPPVNPSELQWIPLISDLPAAAGLGVLADDERAALQRFTTSHGRTWKSRWIRITPAGVAEWERLCDAINAAERKAGV